MAISNTVPAESHVNAIEAKLQLLSRLKSDCDFYLDGHYDQGWMWSGCIEDQLIAMRTLYNELCMLGAEPSWLSVREINFYEQRLYATERFVEENNKICALAAMLGIEESDMVTDNPDFYTPSGRYIVLTDNEADKKATEKIRAFIEGYGLEALKKSGNSFISEVFIEMVRNAGDNMTVTAGSDMPQAEAEAIARNLRSKEKPRNIDSAVAKMTGKNRIPRLDYGKLAKFLPKGTFLAPYDGKEEQYDGFRIYKVDNESYDIEKMKKPEVTHIKCRDLRDGR